MLARMASIREPFCNQISWPVFRSVATAAKGIDKSSMAESDRFSLK